MRNADTYKIIILFDASEHKHYFLAGALGKHPVNIPGKHPCKTPGEFLIKISGGNYQVYHSSYPYKIIGDEIKDY